MKKHLFTKPVILICCYLILIPFVAHSQNMKHSYLKQEFNLAGDHSQETQFYRMKSECINYALDGKRLSKDVYRLYLKWSTANIAGKAGDEMTVVKFTVQFGDSAETAIPVL